MKISETWNFILSIYLECKPHEVRHSLEHCLMQQKKRFKKKKELYFYTLRVLSQICDDQSTSQHQRTSLEQMDPSVKGQIDLGFRTGKNVSSDLYLIFHDNYVYI